MHTPRVEVLRLAAPKANAIDLPFLDRLDALLETFARGPAAAAVLTGTGRFFSVGLAMPALIGLGRADLRRFMNRFDDTMFRLFACPKPIVAAVNGHAIAGGCVIALQCDVRFATDADARIGLNEAQLGIGLPASVLEPLRQVLPPAAWVPVACEGRLFSPTEALGLGLVDALAAAADLEARAVARAEALASIPPAAYAQIKLGLRRVAIEAMQATAADQLEKWLDTWFTPEAQRRMAEAVARLRS